MWDLLGDLIEPLVKAGPLGLAFAVVLVLLVGAVLIMRQLYNRNEKLHTMMQAQSDARTADAKEFATAMALGLRTLDDVKSLLQTVLQMISTPPPRRRR